MTPPDNSKLPEAPKTPRAGRDYHCATHGWWDASRESGCPTCVWHMRCELRDRRSAYDAKARECEELRKDAERYRWIKGAEPDVVERLAWNADDFDAAIDAYRSEGGK